MRTMRMNNKINVKIKKLRPDAVLPSQGSLNAAGVDLYACIDKTVKLFPNETKLISTGLAMQIPDDKYGAIVPRSGLSTKTKVGIINTPGTIDSDYRGEIMVALHNFNIDKIVEIKPFERIAQMIFLPYYTPEFEVVDALEDTDRGNDGFGSTGRM